eukprot:gb/GECG01010689.1/.p1 GENE.gb/GECG01010689.1/~~gb/GECG01010689.1/.p1  ORF type:complete len:119 (+),score=9.34 gb/GECG01010689.1/:1-357(+)
MSWRAFVSRNAQAVRVFVDPTQTAPGQKSHGLMKWYKQNYRELTELNPHMALPIRGVKGTPSMVGVSYDYGQMEWYKCDNRLPHEIDNMLEEAVLKGEYKPRARWQSLTKPELPTIVD